MKNEQKVIADRLRQVIVERLKLPMKPEEIEYDMVLFNDGLGLDSVDSLELVAAIDEEYGVSLTSEHRPYFVNLEKLSGFIVENTEEKDETSA